MNNKQRYSKTSYAGIRKDNEYQGYIATRSFKGKRESRTFKNLMDAVHWKNGSIRKVVEKSKNSFLLKRMQTVEGEELNGRELGHTLGDIWGRYKESHLADKAFATREVALERAKFFEPLHVSKMTAMTPEFFDFYIKDMKEHAISSGNKRRKSFREDLKRLKAIFNWYRENVDYKFRNPILKRHLILGTIEKRSDKKKKLSPEQLMKFFECLEPFWRDVALTQFFLAGRIQEVAGLTFPCVDFEMRSLEIRYVAVWSRKTKEFQELKDAPKNGVARFCHIPDALVEILKQRQQLKHPYGDFVFHLNGEPLKYRQIQYRYNLALQKAGLYPEFSSTHIMRHTMATITRRVTGSLDATQAVTGHKDRRLVEHYASLPSDAQRDAVSSVARFMEGLLGGGGFGGQKREQPKLRLVES